MKKDIKVEKSHAKTFLKSERKKKGIIYAYQSKEGKRSFFFLTKQIFFKVQQCPSILFIFIFFFFKSPLCKWVCVCMYMYLSMCVQYSNKNGQETKHDQYLPDTNSRLLDVDHSYIKLIFNNKS